MPSSRPRDRLEDLLDNIRQAESYLAGLTLEHRWATFDKQPFSAASAFQVSVYRA